MKALFGLACLAFGFTFCDAADLPRSSPESQGVSSAELLSFVDAADKAVDSLHSVMLVRHGHVIAEGWWAPYHAHARHSLYSLSKSFTSTAVGLAIAEGKFSVDDPVLKFFPEDAPADPGDNLRAMRVSDLLRMNTGQQSEPSRKPDEIWTKSFLAHPVPFKPGTHFLYNTSATYMQSAIVQKATGMTVLDFLRPRLFEPLGIEQPTWEMSPQGVSTGGYGLSIRTEDIAKFGQLYLQKGRWDERQLVPAAWVEAATALQTSNGSNPASDWDQGYGYQFWRSRHGAYRGDGAFGQYCIVLPDQDAVVAITSGLRDMQAVLNLVWDKLLPAMKSTALAADEESTAKLQQSLKGLSLRPQEGTASPAKKPAKKFVFAPNEHHLETLAIDFDDKNLATLTLRFEGTDSQISCHSGSWTNGKVAWGVLKDQSVAASGAWTDAETFTCKLCFYETPFVVTMALKFVGNELHYSAKPNVWLFGKSDVQLIGISSEFVPGVSKSIDAGTTVPQPPNPPSNSVAIASRPPVKDHNFKKWEKEIAAFEAADRNSPPPKGGILFVGSSTIRLWKTLAEDFPEHKVINRGFGGSEIVDSTHFAERIIFPHEPRQIFLRAGGNDIHAGRLPEDVATDFTDFVTKVHARLPNTEIYFMAVSPAPSRWGEKDKNRALNDLIRANAVHMPRVGFVDAYDMTLDEQGKAMTRLFVDDMLHFNADGYRRLAAYVRPYLPTSK